MHAFLSSQSADPPPPVHAPATHVFPAENTSPLQLPAPHTAPSAAALHADVLLPTLHAWQALEGLPWPSPQHVPAIRQEPAWSGFAHPEAPAH